MQRANAAKHHKLQCRLIPFTFKKTHFKIAVGPLLISHTASYDNIAYSRFIKLTKAINLRPLNDIIQMQHDVNFLDLTYIFHLLFDIVVV